MVSALLRAGHDAATIRGIFEEQPIGVKYREKKDGARYLSLTIARAQAWTPSQGRLRRPEKPDNASVQLHGHVALRPTWVRERPRSSPLLLYSWERTSQSLSALLDVAADPYDGVALEYTHPQTGGCLLPTMACWIQMLRPGERLKAHRHTGSAVYYVVQGTGETIIDGRRFVWGKGDILALPPWALHEHANRSATDPAILFSIQDRPVLEALGLYREEALMENDGRQAVTATFQP